MKCTRTSILLLLLGVAYNAFGGVDGGNPHHQAFYNMAENYRVSGTALIATPTGLDGAVQFDVPLTYRDLGYFVIAARFPQPSGGAKVCDRYEIIGTRVAVVWVGRDCSHPFFVREFGKLVESVHTLPFAK